MEGTFEHTHELVLGQVGVDSPDEWLSGMHACAQVQASWRGLAKGFSLLEPFSVLPPHSEPEPRPTPAGAIGEC